MFTSQLERFSAEMIYIPSRAKEFLNKQKPIVKFLLASYFIFDRLRQQKSEKSMLRQLKEFQLPLIASPKAVESIERISSCKTF